MRIYKSSRLIESVKRKGMLPETQATFTDQDFLDFATEEIDVAIVPLVLSFNEDYYLYVDKMPISTSNRYKIPHRAIGNKLKYVGVQTGDNISTLFRIAFEDFYSNNYLPNNNYFYIENDEIVLTSNVISGDYIIMAYYLRPNALVPDEQMLRISNISGNTITVNEGDLTLYSTANKIDFISAESPNRLIKIDQPILSINTNNNQLTFSSIPSNVKVGDYICFAEKTAIPQIPLELQSLLTQRVLARCLEALGSVQELQVANAKIAEIEQKITSLIDNRVESNPRKIFGHKFRFGKRTLL
ncbi:MAG: hypothetical protein RML94_09865 [Bacteroidia bacterium]|nr:hypothetical protein [Bacteroidia bacterium]